tara:strand:+ start:6155 stop:6757 length:603 start_codon:yes stop_codon:yes gene_type:complete
MFLFLDVSSPIPEFHIIADKKIVNSTRIIDCSTKKLSDRLIPAYLELDKNYKISQNVKKLIVTTGPGSYTALRVGASFIAGLSQSINLPVSQISNEVMYSKFFNCSNKIGLYFESSNNQKFFSYKKNSLFVNIKIEKEKFDLPNFISIVFYNNSVPNFLNQKVKLEKFSIKDMVIKNLQYLQFDKDLIKPIYISNNSILN